MQNIENNNVNTKYFSCYLIDKSYILDKCCHNIIIYKYVLCTEGLSLHKLGFWVNYVCMYDVFLINLVLTFMLVHYIYNSHMLLKKIIIL